MMCVMWFVGLFSAFQRTAVQLQLYVFSLWYCFVLQGHYKGQ